MLTYDYELIRNEYDKEYSNNHLMPKKKYSPSFSKKLNNLSLIRGRNSKGKSTLLHIIALGLYGLRNDNIHKSLIDKMKALINSGHQKLVFDFSIESEQHNLKVISKKEDPDSDEIMVYEVDKKGTEIPLCFESFRNKYQLIYDIPNNPIGRLYGLLSELQENQRSLGNKLMQLNFSIKNIIQDVKNSKDPKIINEIENKIKVLSEQIKRDCIDYEKIKESLSLFERYTYLKYFFEYKEKKDQAEIELEKLKKATKSNINQKKKKWKEEEQDYKKGHEYINMMIGNINDLIYLIKKNLKNEKEHLFQINILEKLDIKNTMLDEDRNESIISILEYYKNLFKSEQSNLSRSDKYQAADLYKNLIEILNDYVTLDVILPGVEKSIADFIKILKDEWKKYEGLGVKRNNIEKVLELIEDIKAGREYFINNKFAEKMNEFIKKSSNSESQKLTEQELNIIDMNMIKNKIENYKQKIDLYRNKLIKINEDVKTDDFSTIKNSLRELVKDPIIREYLDWEEDQLIQKVDNLLEEVDEKNKEIESKKIRLNNYKRDHTSLNSKEEHRYINNYAFLDELFNSTQKLSSLILNDFESYIGMMRNKNKQFSNHMYSDYVNQVSKYLANKVGTINYDVSILEINSIDLVTGEIKTKDNRIIHLSDLGVGHGQAAYLRGILNSSDNRKIIALIDETAMMDKDTMDSIINKMRELYNEGKLLLGLIVRQDEYEKVESLI